MEKKRASSEECENDGFPDRVGPVERTVSIDEATESYLVQESAGTGALVAPSLRHSVVVGHVAESARLLKGGEDSFGEHCSQAAFFHLVKRVGGRAAGGGDLVSELR